MVYLDEMRSNRFKLPVILSIALILILASITMLVDSGQIPGFNKVQSKLWSVLSESSDERDTSLPAHLLFEETFEGSKPFGRIHDFDVGTWDYAIQYVDTPVYKGLKAVRFEIRDEQPLVASGKRSEVSVIKHIEKEAWYSFAVFFPENGYNYDENREVINQWFQSGSPASSLRTKKDRFLMEIGSSPEGREEFDIGPIKKDTWHTFIIHFIHSNESEGLVELWMDGEKKLTHKGGNMYEGKLPRWKIGLYKAGFKYDNSDVKRRVIYFDEIRVGNSLADFDLMNPAK